MDDTKGDLEGDVRDALAKFGIASKGGGSLQIDTPEALEKLREILTINSLYTLLEMERKEKTVRKQSQELLEYLGSRFSNGVWQIRERDYTAKIQGRAIHKAYRLEFMIGSLRLCSVIAWYGGRSYRGFLHKWDAYAPEKWYRKSKVTSIYANGTEKSLAVVVDRVREGLAEYIAYLQSHIAE